MNYASPSSSESALRIFFIALLLPLRLTGALGAELRLVVVACDTSMEGSGEAALEMVGLVSSSSEESPPARARSSASSTSIMTLYGYWNELSVV